MPTPTTPKVPAPVKAATESVAVPKHVWDALVQKIEKLEAVADKGRLMRYEQQQSSAASVRTAKVTMLQGKLVVAWRMLQNEVYKDLSGRWHEDQYVELTFEDASTAKLSLMEFARMTNDKVTCEIRAKTTTAEGYELVRLALPDGREVELDVKFIN